MTSSKGLVTSYQDVRRHKPEDNLATFDVLTAVLKMQVFWDVTPFRLVMLLTLQPQQFG
jgi:hypothetical protein